MRQLLTLFIFIISLQSLQAQFNLFPDTLMRDRNIDYVLVKRYNPAYSNPEKEEIVYKYLFDKNGLNIAQHSLDSAQQINGKSEFYYTNGVLTSYVGYHSHRIDSENWEISYWESSTMTKKVNYEYEDGKLEYLEWLDDGETLTMDIIYEYDSLNRLIEEFQMHYRNPNSIMEFQAFKPNSTEFLDSIKVNKASENRIKKYSYSGNDCVVEYFINNLQTGVEYQSLDSEFNITSKTICNMKGDTLSIEKFKFNENSRVIENSIWTIGYDGFGNGYDYLNNDRTVFEYDSLGRIIKEKIYYEDKVRTVYEYEYIKK